MELNERSFLISGGGSGLGAGCARRFVAAGARVVLADIDEVRGAALAAELGPAATFVRADVTRADDVERALDAAGDALAGVISCAGVAIGMRVVGRQGPHDLESFTRVIRVNLIGTFNVARLAAVRLVENDPNEDGERGVLINTASVAAFEGQIGQAAYSASKGGVVGMTLPLARDLASRGVRVVTIAPGIFDTPMMQSMPDGVRESLAASIPFPSRFGRPEEYAALAQQIVENPMLNGTVIRLDGAMRMAPR